MTEPIIITPFLFLDPIAIIIISLLTLNFVIAAVVLVIKKNNPKLKIFGKIGWILFIAYAAYTLFFRRFFYPI